MKKTNSVAPRLKANGTYLFSGSDLSGPDAPLINYSGAKRNRIIDQDQDEQRSKFVDTEVARLMKLASEDKQVNLLG